MLKWNKNQTNFTLSGLMMNGKESSIIIYKRFENNYIFSSPELGISLKLIEASDSEDLRKQIITIVRNRMITMIDDIDNNLAMINDATDTCNETSIRAREMVFPA